MISLRLVRTKEKSWLTGGGFSVPALVGKQFASLFLASSPYKNKQQKKKRKKTAVWHLWILQPNIILYTRDIVSGGGGGEVSLSDDENIIIIIIIIILL